MKTKINKEKREEFKKYGKSVILKRKEEKGILKMHLRRNR